MNGSRIAWPLRAWFGVELFFALSATLSVALDPANTAHNFAWTIKPEVMAALFGSFYLALLPVAVLLLCARRWQMVRVFVLPGAAFTAVQLLVTLLHWDRFAVGTGPFLIWFLSYLLPPPVFLACAWWQRRHEVAADRTPSGLDGARSGDAAAASLARWQRLALWSLGALFTLEALLALVWPAWFGSSAPWKVSALNARALAGYLALLGLLMLAMAHENHRDRVRIVAPFLVLLLPAAVLQISRFSTQVNFTHPRLWVLLVLLTVVCGLGLSLLRGSWRSTMR